MSKNYMKQMAKILRPQCKIQSINYMYQIIKEEFAQLLKDRCVL